MRRPSGWCERDADARAVAEDGAAGGGHIGPACTASAAECAAVIACIDPNQRHRARKARVQARTAGGKRDDVQRGGSTGHMGADDAAGGACYGITLKLLFFATTWATWLVRLDN